jgi:hypothetical protein
MGTFGDQKNWMIIVWKQCTRGTVDTEFTITETERRMTLNRLISTFWHANDQVISCEYEEQLQQAAYIQSEHSACSFLVQVQNISQ